MSDTQKKVIKKDNFVLNFSLEDINIILKALSEMPFKDVYDIIGKINFQTNEQMKNKQLKDIKKNIYKKVLYEGSYIIKEEICRIIE